MKANMKSTNTAEATTEVMCGNSQTANEITTNGSVLGEQELSSPEPAHSSSRAPPKVVVSGTSSPDSSLRSPNHDPQTQGARSRLRSKSPNIRRQLILKTGNSPSQSPRTFTTYVKTPRKPGMSLSDTSSDCRVSANSDMCVSTISEPPHSFDSVNLSDHQDNQSTNRSITPLSTNENRYAHVNPAFDFSDELILNPARLWPRGANESDTGDDEEFVEEMVVIERPIYSQKDFDQGFEGGKRPARNISTWVKSKARKYECSLTCVRRFLTARLPFLAIMKQYSPKRDLVPDIIAGLTVGIMHIPQGMAYGQLSTLPPVYGLYVSFFPVILYFFFGTSKHVSIGTFAVISLMVGSAVDKGLKARGLEPTTWNMTVNTGMNATYELVDNSAEIFATKLKLAMSVSFAVGVIQLLLGVFGLGFLTVYLSDPLISGFTTGAACHVFTSQVKHIFGIRMGQYSGAFNLLFSYRDIFLNLPKTNAVTFIASILCIILLVVVKEYINSNPKIKPKLKMPVPVELIVVVLGTLISYFVKLEEVYKVKIVGDIPVGIPPPNIDCFSYLPDVITDAVAIAIVSFAISVSMAKIFAKKYDYEVDSNQELLAYGLCNIFSSFFASFVSAVSLSRSLVQENVGGRTQVTGLVSSVLLLIVLLVVGPYFKTLPNCILASIILVALKGMFLQFLDLKALWSISTIDFAVWIISFAATVLLDVDLGLLVGVGFALLTVIIRSQRPYSCLLGQVPGTDIYKDIGVYKSAEETPNIKIFRFDSALFFANAEFFKSSLYKLTVDPKLLKKKQRRLNKQKKKEEKVLLHVSVDPMGSTNFAPEDIDASMDDIDEDHDDSKPVNDVSVPSVKPNSQPVVVTSTTTGSNLTTTNKVPVVIDTDSSHIKELPTLTDVHFIILDCSTMSYVDSMGVKVLQQVITEFRAFNITVYLAQCKSSVREMFECTNFYKTGSKQCLFVTIHDAVVSAQLHQWSILGERMESSPLADNTHNNGESMGAHQESGKLPERIDNKLNNKSDSLNPQQQHHETRSNCLNNNANNSNTTVSQL